MGWANEWWVTSGQAFWSRAHQFIVVPCTVPHSLSLWLDPFGVLPCLLDMFSFDILRNSGCLSLWKGLSSAHNCSGPYRPARRCTPSLHMMRPKPTRTGAKFWRWLLTGSLELLSICSVRSPPCSSPVGHVYLIVVCAPHLVVVLPHLLLLGPWMSLSIYSAFLCSARHYAATYVLCLPVILILEYSSLLLIWAINFFIALSFIFVIIHHLKEQVAPTAC
jgi:hypothetical protein